MTGHINVIAYLRVWAIVCLPIAGWMVGRRVVEGYIRRRRRVLTRPTPAAYSWPHPDLGKPAKWCACPAPKGREDLPFTPVCSLCDSYISAEHWRNTAAARAARDAGTEGS